MSEVDSRLRVPESGRIAALLSDLMPGSGPNKSASPGSKPEPQSSSEPAAQVDLEQAGLSHQPRMQSKASVAAPAVNPSTLETNQATRNLTFGQFLAELNWTNAPNFQAPTVSTSTAAEPVMDSQPAGKSLAAMNLGEFLLSVNWKNAADWSVADEDDSEPNAGQEFLVENVLAEFVWD